MRKEQIAKIIIKYKPSPLLMILFLIGIIGIAVFYNGYYLNQIVIKYNHGNMPYVCSYFRSDQAGYICESKETRFKILDDRHYFNYSLYSKGDLFLYFGLILLLFSIIEIFLYLSFLIFIMAGGKHGRKRNLKLS